MNEAWQVAELLEEIAKNADPTAIVHRCVVDVVKNTRTANVAFMLQTHPAEGTVTAHYFVPVATAMKGVDGPLEEVIEWLQTGLGPDQEVKLDMNHPMWGQVFIIKQTHRAAYMIDDLIHLMEKMTAEARKAGKLTEGSKTVGTTPERIWAPDRPADMPSP